jgi:acylphosphatase
LFTSALSKPYYFFANFIFLSRMIRQYEIRVYGRVQGVGFRVAARDRARSLELKGWVENLSDGSVRCMVQGDAEACNAYIQWCREGTGYSWVERLEIKEEPPSALEGFSIRH